MSPQPHGTVLGSLHIPPLFITMDSSGRPETSSALTSHCPQDTNGLSLEPPRTALFHKKIIKVASPAVLTCGPLLRSLVGPENAPFSSEVYQRLPGHFPTSGATDLPAFSVTISHQKRHPFPNSVNDEQLGCRIRFTAKPPPFLAEIKGSAPQGEAGGAGHCPCSTKSPLQPRVAQRPRVQPHSQTFQEAPQDAISCLCPALSRQSHSSNPGKPCRRKNPRQGESRHSEHHSCAAGMHPLPHSTHRTCGQPQPSPPVSQLSGGLSRGAG